MKEFDVVIVGGGCAGLMAAKELSCRNLSVLIVEARNRLGGRVYSIPSGDTNLELGAEFIHGALPLTLSILKEAGLEYTAVGGRSFRLIAGRLSAQEEFIEDWAYLIRRLEHLDEDCTLSEFLKDFPDGEKYDKLKKSVIDFAQGYDAADPDKISVLSLKGEWESEQEEQYRPSKGYGPMVDYLASECKRQGAQLKLNSPVFKLIRKQTGVQVLTKGEEQFFAKKVIITVPLGVLKADAIKFEPPITEVNQLLSEIGFGNVIKFLLKFSRCLWADVPELRAAGFIFSNETIPTWWTALPGESPLLTGWLAGPPADALSSLSQEGLVDVALQSLSLLFNRQQSELRDLLDEVHIYDWSKDDYSGGAYSYSTVQTPAVLPLLRQPIDKQLYFAGEALYDGPAKATVEAALVSGKQVADMISAELGYSTSS